MKKFITTFMMLAMMAVAIPMLSTEAAAQSDCYRDSNGRVVCNDGNRSIYDKHRNLINIGIGTAAGAIIGGLIGGKKGALIGTVAGAGGAALYTYKLNPKTKRYERVYSRNYRRY
ncbi:MAG: hypothetical protein ABIR33_13245 [Pyrinomonadaceae bacterium]